MKNYSKPQIVAKNAPTGSYAAGCPGWGAGTGDMGCRACSRAL